MSLTQTSPEAVKGKKPELVTVSIGLTGDDGSTLEVEKLIPAGPTDVAVLMQELDVPEDSSLWIVKNGKKKVLAEHEKHNVKAGDHYEALVKGGVSG